MYLLWMNDLYTSCFKGLILEKCKCNFKKIIKAMKNSPGRGWQIATPSLKIRPLNKKIRARKIILHLWWDNVQDSVTWTIIFEDRKQMGRKNYWVERKIKRNAWGEGVSKGPSGLFSTIPENFRNWDARNFIGRG